MFRLSRSMRMSRWMTPIALAMWAAAAFASVYVALLNHRLTRELVGHRWREPTVVLSADARSRVTILYGAGWRTTPPITLAALPDYVPLAFMAAEDVRFRHHIGIDPIGMARALWTDLRAGGIAQGGSTIDQQIVKPRFLSQERTRHRKIPAILLTSTLDAVLSKDAIT